MVLIFFDTEFTDLHHAAKLISIGCVAEDGRTFYAELADTYRLEDCSDFVKETVLPLLQGGEARMSLRDLTLRLGNWLESFGDPVTLATDSESWDWPWIERLFEMPGTWPANLDRRSLLLGVGDADSFWSAVQKAHGHGLREHHALDDAKANLAGWLAGR